MLTLSELQVEAGDWDGRAREPRPAALAGHRV